MDPEHLVSCVEDFLKAREMMSAKKIRYSPYTLAHFSHDQDSHPAKTRED